MPPDPDRPKARDLLAALDQPVGRQVGVGPLEEGLVPVGDDHLGVEPVDDPRERAVVVGVLVFDDDPLDTTGGLEFPQQLVGAQGVTRPEQRVTDEVTADRLVGRGCEVGW